MNWAWATSIAKRNRILETALENGDLQEMSPEHCEDIAKIAELSWLLACYDHGILQGFLLFEFVNSEERIAMVHVCRLKSARIDGTAELMKIWPDVKTNFNKLIAYISLDKPGVMLLAKRLGFKFKKTKDHYHGQIN